MRKFFSIILTVAMLAAFTVPAIADTTAGIFQADRYAGQNRYTTDLAPIAQKIVKVTKEFYNLDLSQLTQYKFWFTKTADDTAATVICKMLVGGYTTGTEAGIPVTTDRFVRGAGQNFTGFKCASSAGTNLNFILQ